VQIVPSPPETVAESGKSRSGHCDFQASHRGRKQARSRLLADSANGDRLDIQASVDLTGLEKLKERGGYSGGDSPGDLSHSLM
jgi:hypothetical protein